MSTRVLATGVFDILHPGHIYYLQEAKKLGDTLIVLVTSDVVAAKQKRQPVFNQEDRQEMIASLKIVDEVVIGNEDHDYGKTLAKTRPDIIVLGYNQRMDEVELANVLAKYNWHGNIVRLKKSPLKEHSTTNITRTIKQRKDL